MNKKMNAGASVIPMKISCLSKALSIEKPLVGVLEKCESMKHMKQIISQMIKAGLSVNFAVQSRVVMFCCTHELGDMNCARLLFDDIPNPSVFLSNVMIKGYSRIGCPEMGVSMYIDMLRRHIQPDCYTFPYLLKGFKSDMTLKFGRGLHTHVIKFGLDSNPYVQKGFVHVYSSCGLVDMAQRLFDMECTWEVVTWNVLISGYNRVKQFEKSKKLFYDMQKKGVAPNSITLVLMLSACSKLKDLDCGNRIHSHAKESKFEPSLTLENALLDMFASCGQMDIALEIFVKMKTRDVISWTSIVTGYARLGEIDVARKYFDRMPERDYISWSAMIDGLLKVNRFKEALELFRLMQTSNIKPDEFTMVSILTACAHLGAVELGERVRTYIDKNRIKNDTFVGNALLDMYFKCGDVDKAKAVFNEMQHRDKFTWTTMIFGLAVNGNGAEALHMFSQMLEASIIPDEITFIGVLCACAHTGMVDEGRKHFATMTIQHGIKPSIAHYGCMVDILGRVGLLDKAYELIKNMPMKPNFIVWRALLAACRVHKNAEMAETAAKQILELEPENGAVYVLLCNIYAACGRWKSFHELKQMMMDRGITKNAGCSMIEMNGSVHEFAAGDQSHSQSKVIYAKLESVISELKFSGDSPHSSEVSLDGKRIKKMQSIGIESSWL